MKREKKLTLAIVALIGSAPIAFGGSSQPFRQCVDAGNRFEISDYKQIDVALATVHAVVDGVEYRLLCGLTEDSADPIEFACANHSGGGAVTLRMHRLPAHGPRTAVIAGPDAGSKPNIENIVPMACE